MGKFLNKITLQYNKSGHTPDFPAKDWIENPTFPESPRKYWKIFKNKVVEMSQVEKDIIDKTALKESLILSKDKTLARDGAILALKVDGVLDSKGELI